MNVKEQITNAFNFRYACKEFDTTRKIPENDFSVILESARLSPSSFGFEPWKLLVLQDMNIREKIKPFCWGAQLQLPSASHFVILLSHTGKDMKYDSDYIKETMEKLQKSTPEVVKLRLERLKKFQEKDFELNDDVTLFDWACKQSYIALANMMTSASLLGIDSCPIEGFNREQVEEILINKNILDKNHFGIACMVAFGYRITSPEKQKTRRTLSEVIEWIK